MQLSNRTGRWILIVGVLLVVLGALIAIRDLRAGAAITLQAYIAVAAGITGVILSRKSGESEEEEPA